MAVGMKPDDFDAALEFLRIDEHEAAALLHCTKRSIERWKVIGVPHSVAMTVRAWVKLKQIGQPWRPDAISLLAFGDAAEIRERVKARGGVAAPWFIDMEKERAELGPVLITFQKDPAGAIRPISYDRSDTRPNLERDRLLIEDGIARIAMAV